MCHISGLLLIGTVALGCMDQELKELNWLWCGMETSSFNNRKNAL